MSGDVIDRELAEKERGLLEQDYAAPCANCGGVVFEWWDSETCRDCEESTQEISTEQATLINDGGRVGDGVEHLATVSSIGSGSDYIRCTTCGREAVNVDELEHRDGCPEVNDAE